MSKPTTEAVTVAGCRVPIDEQIQQLMELEDGWLDGDGKAYSSKVVTDVGDLLHQIVDAGVPIPFIYPAIDNSISAEWSAPRCEVSLTLSPDASTARLIVVGMVKHDARYRLADVGVVA